ncbi:MlaA family lipoprotein [Luteimonas terricola]|uniref:Lipoprotein n=1 Tax=Luteimonas terricola TaxID=645597 RepID=A0ABQ2EMP3_9GAMM|nr:VacJ family lipoprotein [Luteimonas terricola]GGK16813.1 lipoprotein [Luteimonas terricola]
MHSQVPSRLRTAAAALALALLVGCAGTAPRAQAPLEPAATVAATADHGTIDGSTAIHDAAAAGTQADIGSEAAALDGHAGALPADGFDPDPDPASSDGFDAAEPGRDPTQAELDFAAIYGGDVYDPVADPTLPAPAQLPGASHDPWEGWNRRVHGFNMAIDRAVAEPLARAYMKAVPRPMRLGVGNFFSNLGQPVSALNALLQGKPKQAGQSLGRFLVNATIGVGGLFDPASRMHIPNRSEDFGQTLGVWGWETSRYVELPLFGPRTVRDVFGLVGDGQVSPLRQVDDDAVRIGLQGLQLVDLRTQLFAVDRLREGAADEYALVRDAWMQRRNYQIHGDSIREDQSDLPDYLLEDEANPTVPVDVMPIVPGSGS